MKKDVLLAVEKPTRYIGGEINSYDKKIEEMDLHMCLCFPDLYEIGMSHYGLHLLYQLINRESNYFCERSFMPDLDLLEYIKKGEYAMCSLETKTPLSDFDIVGFTMQYELSYTNVLYMLDLAGIPLRSRNRGEESPIILAGGPTIMNPEPMSAFFDMILLGDAEESLPELLSLYTKKPKLKRSVFLEEASKIRGIYVPALYDKKDGKLFSKKTKEEVIIQRALIKNLDDVQIPEHAQIVPYMDTVHDRGAIEIFRGCTQGCRFCQAGMIYRPVREKSKEMIKRQIDSLIKKGGYREVSLMSLSTLDYSAIDELIDMILNSGDDQGLSLSLPSLRMDTFSIDVLRKISGRKKIGLTFAPEAGTPRMRRVINKNINEEDIEKTLKSVFALGYTRVKLYFILGLPTETMDDVQGIVDLVKRIKYWYKKVGSNRELRLTVSTSNLVPKPFTPFQWVKQEKESIEEKQNYLKQKLRRLQVQYNYHANEETLLEGYVARGERDAANLIEKAYRLGATFDAWSSRRNLQSWFDAMDELSIQEKDLLKGFSLDEPLPWDFIDIGVTKRFLIREYQLALQAQQTPDCRKGCLGCGVNTKDFGGVCLEYSNSL